MINTTTTVETTFQVLDPIIVPPPGTNPLAYVEEGYTNLPVGQQEVTIPFTVQKVADYVFAELEIVNIADATVLTITTEIVAFDSNGFSVILNGTPDTANYYLKWRVGVPPA